MFHDLIGRRICTGNAPPERFHIVPFCRQRSRTSHEDSAPLPAGPCRAAGLSGTGLRVALAGRYQLVDRLAGAGAPLGPRLAEHPARAGQAAVRSAVEGLCGAQRLPPGGNQPAAGTPPRVRHSGQPATQRLCRARWHHRRQRRPAAARTHRGGVCLGHGPRTGAPVTTPLCPRTGSTETHTGSPNGRHAGRRGGRCSRCRRGRHCRHHRQPGRRLPGATALFTAKRAGGRPAGPAKPGTGRVRPAGHARHVRAPAAPVPL